MLECWDAGSGVDGELVGALWVVGVGFGGWGVEGRKGGEVPCCLHCLRLTVMAVLVNGD